MDNDVYLTLNQQFSQLYNEIGNRAPQFAVGFIVLILTYFIGRFTDRFLPLLLERFNIRRARVIVTTKLIIIFQWFLGILLFMMIAFPSITPGNTLTTLGLSTIAVGFAFKDIIENFFAGTLILLREPFKLRDFIRCEEYEGIVEQITVRDTHIRRSDGQRVVLPNATLFTNPVTVVTDRELRRVGITCGIAYKEHLLIAREVIKEKVAKLPTVSRRHDVLVLAKKFGPTGVFFDLFWWTGSSQQEMRRSRDEVVCAVKEVLDEEGIEMAYPLTHLLLQGGDDEIQG